MVAGSAQVGAPTPTVLLQANDGGLDLVYFAGCDVYPTQSKTGILAMIGSNLQGPRDLPGKKIGVPGFNGIVDLLTRKWIQSAGGDAKKVTYIELQFPAMRDALKSGLVDAVALLDPFYSRIADALSIPNNLTNRPTVASMRFWVELMKEQSLIRGNPDASRLIAP